MPTTTPATSPTVREPVTHTDLRVGRVALLDVVDDLLLFLQGLSIQEEPDEISGATVAVLRLLGDKQAVEARRIAKYLVGSADVTPAEPTWLQLCYLAIVLPATLSGFAEGDSILDLHSLTEFLEHARGAVRPFSSPGTR